MVKNVFSIVGFAVVILLSSASLFGQVTLEADGSADSYSLIDSKGFGIETPDCVHTSFGQHVTQTFDSELGKYVFVFHSHIDEDNDRCLNFDRVRMEIKGDTGAPAALQHTEGQTAYYRWKFRLASDFVGSSSFTHIFQIKAQGGSDSGAPIITITPRSSIIEVIHSGGDTGTDLGQLTSASLSPFLGTWIEAYVRYESSESGNFEISLTRISDGQTLLSYNGSGLDLWRDSTINRPKWGVYRKKDETKKDEQVRFADFCISESSASQCPSGTDTVFPIEPDTPFDQNLIIGQDVTLEVIPVPEVTILAYEWFEATGSGDVAIGTNSPILTIANAQEADGARRFYCRVTTDEGTFTSRTARIRSLLGSLRLHIPFDDDTATDISGDGNHGTLEGTAAVVDDPERGKVLSLDGVGSKVELGNPESLNVTDECTVMAWVYNTGQMQSNAGIVQRGHQSSPSREFVLRIGNTGADYDFGTWSPNQHASLAVPPEDVGAWVHLAGTMTNDGGTFTYRLYRNGVLVGTAGPFSNGLRDDFTVGWAIGARGGVNGFERVFRGLIDDVRIYDVSLTPEEIREIMIGSRTDQAHNPRPVDGAGLAPLNTILTWDDPDDPNDETVAFNVYFGADPNCDLNPQVVADQEVNLFEPPEGLDPDTTYTWRVDVIDPNGGGVPIVVPGDCWTFTTLPASVALNVDKVLVRAGKDRDNPQDTILLQGELALDEAAYQTATLIRVRVGTNDAVIYERTIPHPGRNEALPEIRQGRVNFKGPGDPATAGGRFQLQLAFNRNSRTGRYKIIGRQIDLSGLEATVTNPLVVELLFGGFNGVAELVEDPNDVTINSRQSMPLCLLSGVKDVVSVDTVRARPDQIKINKGQIAALNPDLDLSGADVTVFWDLFEETLPAGAFVNKGNGKFIYRKPRDGSENLKITQMLVDLNRCNLKLQIRNAENLTSAGSALFSLQADDGGDAFDAAVVVDLSD